VQLICKLPPGLQEPPGDVVGQVAAGPVLMESTATAVTVILLLPLALKGTL
jgi:hypothetical protein